MTPTSDLGSLREEVRQRLWRLRFTDNTPGFHFESDINERVQAVEDLVELLVMAVFKLAQHPTDVFGEPVDLERGQGG